MKNSRILVLTMLVATTLGCTSSIPYQLSDTQKLIPTSIIDNRSAEEIEGGLPLSKAVYSVPAKRFEPGLLDMLGHRLHQEFGTEINNWQIVVNRFRVANSFGATYRNSQAASAGAAAAGGNHELAVILSSADRGEIDAVIVNIEGQINKVPFDGNSAVEYSGKPPSQLYMGMVYDNPSAREATRKAVELALDDAIASIANSR